MRWITRVKSPKPAYHPFTQPRYRGNWPYPTKKPTNVGYSYGKPVKNEYWRARYIPTSFAALSVTKQAHPKAVSGEGSPIRIWGTPKWGLPRAPMANIIVSPSERLKEHQRRILNPPNWSPKPKLKNVIRYIDKYGYQSFKEKICQERRARREVMHAKAIAGTSVSKPTFDVRSLVRC